MDVPRCAKCSVFSPGAALSLLAAPCPDPQHLGEPACSSGARRLQGQCPRGMGEVWSCDGSFCGCFSEGEG